MNKIRILKFVDSTLGAMLCRSIGARTSQTFPLQPVDPARVHRILVIRPGGMGDMLVLLPVLDALHRHFPGATLDLIGETRNLEVLHLADIPAEFIAYDSSPGRLVRILHRRQYDLAIDSEQFHHFSAWFAWLSRAPIRVGFKINPNRNSLYTHLVNYSPSGYEGDQFMALLQPAGIPHASYRLHGRLANSRPMLRPAARQAIADCAAAGPFVVFHPGASTPQKEWPEPAAVELIIKMTRDLNLATVLVGDSGARPRSERLADCARSGGAKVTVVAGRFTLSETAALLQAARAFVGADSGLSHLAYALGLPAVTFFGPSDSLKWGHPGPRQSILHSDLPCAPCAIFGYHKTCRTIECMRKIRPEAVLDACRQVLK